MINLVEDKSSCCGCGACHDVCSQKAIAMIKDEYGFVYPRINADSCIECGVCQKVCAYQNQESSRSKPFIVYAGYNKDKLCRERASSGGIFELIAEKFIESGGYVAGAVLDFDMGVPFVHHILTKEKKDIERMCGSKYVHSDTCNLFSEIKQKLMEGEKVLFSGTPCQVSQIKRYTAKFSKKLHTLEILCHGTPSQDMFQNAVKYWNLRFRGAIISFRFRDKVLSWGHNAEIIYKKGQKECRRVMPASCLSYFAYFLQSMIIRPNCYECPYAGESREGDLTIGDYWGIEKYHPEAKQEMKKGISCILVNTEKGKNFILECNSEISLIESCLESVKKMNGSLNAPNKRSSMNKTIMNIYKESGYAGVAKYYKKQLGIKWYIFEFKGILSPETKCKIKNFFKSK